MVNVTPSVVALHIPPAPRPSAPMPLFFLYNTYGHVSICLIHLCRSSCEHRDCVAVSTSVPRTQDWMQKRLSGQGVSSQTEKDREGLKGTSRGRDFLPTVLVLSHLSSLPFTFQLASRIQNQELAYGWQKARQGLPKQSRTELTQNATPQGI